MGAGADAFGSSAGAGATSERVIGPIFVTLNNTQTVSSSNSVPPSPCSARTYGVAPGVVGLGGGVAPIAPAMMK